MSRPRGPRGDAATCASLRRLCPGRRCSMIDRLRGIRTVGISRGATDGGAKGSLHRAVRRARTNLDPMDDTPTSQRFFPTRPLLRRSIRGRSARWAARLVPLLALCLSAGATPDAKPNPSECRASPASLESRGRPPTAWAGGCRRRTRSGRPGTDSWASSTSSGMTTAGGSPAGGSGPIRRLEDPGHRPDAARKHPDSPLWGPTALYHYWGEPLYGYYLSDDPWVLRRHAQLLADAGIDTLIFDTTNAATYPRSTRSSAMSSTRFAGPAGARRRSRSWSTPGPARRREQIYQRPLPARPAIAICGSSGKASRC